MSFDMTCPPCQFTIKECEVPPKTHDMSSVGAHIATESWLQQLSSAIQAAWRKRLQGYTKVTLGGINKQARIRFGFQVKQEKTHLKLILLLLVPYSLCLRTRLQMSLLCMIGAILSVPTTQVHDPQDPSSSRFEQEGLNRRFRCPDLILLHLLC
ncbi:hypothetical protein BKA67DRAFT_645082 [Truncatella angustata]|uniref:Uncharacterized protein n=1 Tax=Truncatella angustata TaxID=152316 RepID=A0A9P8UNT8_9PEZI|nr:uncharacterized protein BKA67DRAFT_645082 [Truncatella angustata]KAH6655607.1 hypothetical protein BKA67DRAFT_645082 [Truncatella angustata]